MRVIRKKVIVVGGDLCDKVGKDFGCRAELESLVGDGRSGMVVEVGVVVDEMNVDEDVEIELIW